MTVDDESFKTELADRLSGFSSAPILFVGSGLSRRYRGLPNWEGLLKKLSVYTGKPYAYYRSSTSGDLEAVASAMADDLHESIWSEKLLDVRTRHEADLINRYSSLKVLVSEIISDFHDIRDSDLEEELKLFEKVEVDAIITTNYDNLLETIFPDFKTYVGQDELLMSDSQGVGEIYKIHGGIEKPNSIVITKEDFDDYSDKYAYLAAKLMTFFAEHPIIFIGYSISDRNISSILDSLVKCMNSEYLSKLQNRLIFVKIGEPSSVNSTVIATSGVQLPVVNVTVPDFKNLFEVLGSLERKFPAHILRRLKERVYELVLTNDPVGKLYVDDIENSSPDSVEVVLGVGIREGVGSRGYVTFSRLDICLDVLDGGTNIDAKELLNKTIPPLQGVIPIIKYMLQAGYLDRDGRLKDGDNLNERIKIRYANNLGDSLPSESVKKRSVTLARQFHTFDELAANNDVYHTLVSIGSLSPKDIDVGNLKAYLLSYAETAKSDTNFRSTWAKAVCLYDRLINLDNPW